MSVYNFVAFTLTSDMILKVVSWWYLVLDSWVWVQWNEKGYSDGATILTGFLIKVKFRERLNRLDTLKLMHTVKIRMITSGEDIVAKVLLCWT